MPRTMRDHVERGGPPVVDCWRVREFECADERRVNALAHARTRRDGVRGVAGEARAFENAGGGFEYRVDGGGGTSLHGPLARL